MKKGIFLLAKKSSTQLEGNKKTSPALVFFLPYFFTIEERFKEIPLIFSILLLQLANNNAFLSTKDTTLACTPTTLYKMEEEQNVACKKLNLVYWEKKVLKQNGSVESTGEALQEDDIGAERATLFVVPTCHPAGPTAKLLQLIPGILYYEERQLFHLFLLKRPRFRVVFVSSMPIEPPIIDYYFSILQSTGQ